MRKFHLPVLVLVVVGVGLVISANYLRSHPLRSSSHAAGTAALFFTPSSVTVSPNSTINADLYLNTGSDSTYGTDIVLAYPANLLNPTSVTLNPGNSSLLTLKTLAPLDATTGAFDLARAKVSPGVLDFGAEAFNWPTQTTTAAFSGTIWLARVQFQTLGAGSGTLALVNNSGTTDTNVASTTGVDILGSTGSMAFTIATVETGTPTPIPTAPVATATPTRTPTPLPTATTTPTPLPGTPTPTPIGATLVNISLHLQGVTSPATSQTTKQFHITINQAGNQIINTNYSFSYLGSDVYKLNTALNLGTHTGLFDIYIKGPSHLQRKWLNIPLYTGTNAPPLDPPTPLRAGDIVTSPTSEYNILNINDVSALLSKYTSLTIPVSGTDLIYDLDLNGVITINDISLILSNYTSLSVPGDN